MQEEEQLVDIVRRAAQVLCVLRYVLVHQVGALAVRHVRPWSPRAAPRVAAVAGRVVGGALVGYRRRQQRRRQCSGQQARGGAHPECPPTPRGCC